MVKLGFHHFCFSPLHMMYIDIALRVQNFIHVASIVIQQNMRSHSSALLYILHTCFSICLLQHTHIIFVVVLHGSFCICNSWLSVILPFLVCCVPVRSICSYQISMYTFFHSFCACETCH